MSFGRLGSLGAGFGRMGGGGGSGVDPLAPGAITLVGTTPTNDTTPPLTIGWPATVAEGWDLVIDEISTATNYITHTLTAQDITDIGNEVPLSFSGASAIAAGTRTFRGHLDNAGHLGPDSDDEVLVIDTTAPSSPTLSPADNATDIAVGANLTLTFAEDVQFGATVSIAIKKTSDDSTVQAFTEADINGALSISGAVVTINPSDLPAGTEVYVQVTNGSIKDLAGNSFAGITNTTDWSFTTAGGAYSTTGAVFDGTNDFMSRGAGLTGASDGAFGLISFWVDFAGGDGNFQIMFENAGQTVNIFRTNVNKINVTTANPGGSGLTNLLTTSTFVAADGPKHVLISIDASAGNSEIWVDDVKEHDQIHSGGETNDWTSTDWFVGARGGGSLKCDMTIWDLYVNMAETLDLNTEANRRKFITAGGDPVDLGADGSTPTGTAPIIFCKGGGSSFNTNLGSGGNFTVTGALTDGAALP